MVLQLIRSLLSLLFGTCFCCTGILCAFAIPLITILVLGVITTPLSINADIILNEAGNAAQSLADAYNGMSDFVNDLLACVNPLISFYNRLVSGVFSLANIIAIEAGASSPWGWASRDMQLRAQERVHDRIELREQLRFNEAQALNLDNYEAIPEAFRPHIDNAIEKRITEHFRQIDAGERGVFPPALCNLITFVSDLATNIIDIVLPFVRSLVGAIIEAINKSNGNVVSFITVLVKFIIVELLKLIPFGYCFLDIPYSILGCVCFNVSPPYPTDVPTFIGRCFFSGFCSSDTLNSANTIVEIFFKCLHLDTLQTAVNAVLGAVNSAIDFVSGIIKEIQGFISNLSDFQGTLNKLQGVINKIRGALGLRGDTDAWMPADDILLQVRAVIADDDAERALLLQPAIRAGSALWIIYKCITFYDIANNESCILNLFSRDDDAFDAPTFTMNDEKVARIRTIITHFYDDKNLAGEDIIDDLREYIQAPYGSAAVTIDFAERIATLKQHPLYLIPNASALPAIEPPEVRVVRFIAAYYNCTLPVDNTPYASPANRTWHTAPTFDERFSALIEENPGDTSIHQFARSVHALVGEQDTRYHINRIGLLFAHVTNVFVHLLTTDELPPMDEIMLRMAGEYCEQLDENPFSPSSHCQPDVFANAVQSLAILADNSRATHNISRGDEFEARMELHRTKRWSTSEHKMTDAQYADFAARANTILETRAENAKNKVFDVEKRFILLIGITAGGVLALVGVGAIPLVAGVALLPVIVAAALPLLLLVAPLFIFIIQFLMHMAIGLIGNMLNGGAYVYEDYTTPFFIAVGQDVLNLLKHEATIADIQAIAADTSTAAVGVLDSIGAYALQQISCLIPPLFGLTCAVTPPPGITTANYFNLVIYSNIGASCVADVGDNNGNFACTLGSRCRAPDPNGPQPDAQRDCTAQNPCFSPMGKCTSWPLLPEGLYLSKYQINITYDVSTEPYPKEGVKYFNSASFQEHGFSWRYIFSTGFFSFMWACMLCVYFAFRDILRIVIVGFQLPPQVLVFGSLVSLPLVPGVLGLLRPLGFFSWTVPMRIQAVAIFLIPIIVWFENSPFVWITTVFGGPNLATWLLSFLRWPNYLDSPPFGSATAAVYVNLVRFLPFIMIGVDFWIFWIVIVFCFFFFGGFEILLLLACLLIWPIKYALTSKQFVHAVLVLRNKGAFDELPAGQTPLTFAKVGKTTVGIPTPVDAPMQRPSVARTLATNLPQIVTPSFVQSVGSKEGVNTAEHVYKPATKKQPARKLREAAPFSFDDE